MKPIFQDTSLGLQESTTGEVRPLKVLVSAFAFSPVRGSEFAVGWDYVQAIASKHRVWVITRTIEREETEVYLREHSGALPNVTIVYVPEKERRFRFPLSEFVYHFLYRRWQSRAYRYARALDAEVDFDLVHHLNGIGFREPGYLWKLGKPFIWGPIGGLQFFPWRLLNAVPFRWRLFFVLKNLTTAWEMYISRRPRLAARSARRILATSSNVAEKVKSLWNQDATILPEVSAPESVTGLPGRRATEEPLRVVWCGNCDPAKSLNIVLLALARLKGTSANFQLIAAGDGPMLLRWKYLSGKLGISNRCSFPGRLPRAQVHALMATSHCLVQPSLYDATSTVVAEALAYGLPVICLDHFGFKDAVSSECGIKVPPRKLNQVIQDFAKAIELIALDENRRYEMAVAAQKASLRLTRKYKANVIQALYGQALSEASIEPRMEV